MGLLAAIMTIVPYWNWYGFPTDFSLAQIIQHTVGWLLAGIALAAIVRPASAKTAGGNALRLSGGPVHGISPGATSAPGHEPGATPGLKK